ncbi:MAG: AMP-binding protein [Henriciella sp.]|nr:AMP-binding protein [Henriciella sp.]
MTSTQTSENSLLSFVSGETESPLYEGTIGDALKRAADLWPDRDAVVSCHQGLRFSYSQLLQQANDLAAGLLALGLAPGDRVGIWSPNCAEWTITQYATALAGMVLVNINPDYRAGELEYALNKVGCKALIMAARSRHSDYVEIIRSLLDEPGEGSDKTLRSSQLPELKTLILIGDEPVAGFHLFPDVLSSGTADEHQQLERIQSGLDRNDAINIQFTSGTTGAPKGATLTHRNILNNAFFCGRAQDLTPDDRLCIPVPLYHCFGMVMGNLACCMHGSAAIYPSEKFDPQAALKAISDERCTSAYGVPTMFISLLEQDNFSDFDLSALRTGVLAGAPCPIEVMKQVIADMNMQDVTIAYGMTETSPISFQTEKNDPLEKRVATVGKVQPHVEVKVVDETGKTLARGIKGELCTRGYSVMLGYWNDPERTREAIDEDGWMRTGDLATLDKDGYCDIVGRVKDMLIRGGENIFPREVEDFLFTHPDIVEAQVFGVPDKRYGEEVCAWLRLAPGKSLTEDDIRSFCKDQIAHFKIPRYIRFVEEYPMTVTGKIKKNVMREKMAEALESDAVTK